MFCSRDSGMISMIEGQCVIGRWMKVITCHDALVITRDLSKNAPINTQSKDGHGRRSRKSIRNGHSSLLPALRAALYITSGNRLSKRLQK